MEPPSAQTLKDRDFIKQFAGRHSLTHNGIDAVYLTIELRDLRGQTIEDANVRGTLSALIRCLGYYGIDARIGRHGRDLWIRDLEIENTAVIGNMEYASDDEIDCIARKESGVTSIFNQKHITPEQRAHTAQHAGYMPGRVISLVIPTQGRSTENIASQTDTIYREALAALL